MANPIPWPSTPNQDKPVLTIESPQNNTVTNETDVYLNFKVTNPDSWYDPQWFMPYIGEVASVTMSLDGKSISTSPVYPNNGHNYSVNINLTASGLHMLNVTVLSYTYYRGPAYNGSHILSDINSSSGPVYEYPLVISDFVYFTVVGETSPSPLAQPESFPCATFVIVSALVAIAIAACAGLIFYNAKRKRSLTAV